MKIAYIIVRSLLGLMLLVGSVSYFYMVAAHKMPAPPPGAATTYMAGISLANIMNIVKFIELVCGILFITGRFNALAAIIIFPILINIALFHGYIEPSGVPVSIALIIADLFIAYYYRDKYKPLFESK
ncbi:MAG: DoxX family protein [Mucilaginibacter sp.]|uniref:DoxX family protein n=1 Tax=Mucilaginibacter sp. TaxID=1882438 RepID=UPI0032677148